MCIDIYRILNGLQMINDIYDDNDDDDDNNNNDDNNNL